MRRKPKQTSDDMLPEYDFSGAIRGKYALRMAAGSNLVVLDPDVAKAFPDSATVNAALRALMPKAHKRKRAR